jgi:MFS superfamily sulfate permease-like transporter
MNSSFFKNLRYDLPAGVVVFLVALPLCLGIALASGAPFFSGMIAGIIGGIVIGALSDSQLSVSGPAAGLAAIVLSSIATLGDFRVFLLAVVLAGAIQVVLGAVKAGSIADYFPNNVIKGMLVGIGIIIMLKQIPHAFGYDKDPEGELSFMEMDGGNTFGSVFGVFQHIHWGATLVCLLSLGIILLWEKYKLKDKVFGLPGALVAVVASVLANVLLLSNLGPAWHIDGQHLVEVPVANSFEEFAGFFALPDFTQWANVEVYKVALTIAVIASIETLLCIEATDKLDPERRVTSTNRELFAQGVGNMASGMLGGLPVTSVIVRSSTNLQASAKSKTSAIFHGVLLLVCVAFIPKVLNMIPLAALAAILLQVGYKLAHPKVFKSVFATSKHQYWPFIATVAAVVLTDLLTGVLLGMAISIFFILRGNLKNSYFFHADRYHEGDVILIHLSEEVSFLNKASIRQTLDHLPSNSKVVIDASDSKYIDFDVLEAIKEFREVKAPLRNIDCKTFGFRDAYKIENTDNVQSLQQLLPRYKEIKDTAIEIF